MDLWADISTAIFQATDQPFQPKKRVSLTGGCINQAYRVDGQERSFFVKLNRSELLDMFIAESEGLLEMQASQSVRVPRPVCYGTSGDQAYLVLEALDLEGSSSAGKMARLGEQLAGMHQYCKNRFGWHRDNTIGSTPQVNDWCESWIDFWRDHRLGYQLQLAAHKGVSRSLLNKGEQLQDRLDTFFSGYQPQASLLHGDLWSGNYAISKQGEPVIFDPAVYFGDREADIAMTELFGGFGRDFYAAYQATWPLDEGYEVRKTLYNLYHILNHFNLFGGGYASQAETMIERLL